MPQSIYKIFSPKLETMQELPPSELGTSHPERCRALAPAEEMLCGSRNIFRNGKCNRNNIVQNSHILQTQHMFFNLYIYIYVYAYSSAAHR